MDLAAASTFHLALLATSNHADDTIRKYGMEQRLFLSFVSARLGGESPPLAALNRDSLAAFLTWLQTEHRSPRRGGATVGHSDVSVRQYVVDLKAWSSFLTAQGQFDRDPLDAFPLPKVEAKVIPRFSAEDVRAMLGTAARSRLAERNVAIVVVLAETGVRASELCGLVLDDLERWTAKRPGRCLVRGKGRKQRLVYFGRRVDVQLAAWLRRRKPLGLAPWLFLDRHGQQLDRRELADLVRTLGERAGVAVRVTPHGFRRFMATEFLKQNPGQLHQLQILLGHSGIGQTLEYAKLVDRDVETVYRSLLDGWGRDGRGR